MAQNKRELHWTGNLSLTKALSVKRQNRLDRARRNGGHYLSVEKNAKRNRG